MSTTVLTRLSGSLWPWLLDHGISAAALLVGTVWLWKVRREHVLRKRLDLANEISDLLSELTRIVKLWAEVDGRGEDTYEKLTERLEQISPRVFGMQWGASLLMPWRIQKALRGIIRATGMTTSGPTVEMATALKTYTRPNQQTAFTEARAEGVREATRKTKVEAPQLFERRCLALMNLLRIMLHGPVHGRILNWQHRRMRLVDTSFWEQAVSPPPASEPVADRGKTPAA
jgi:hypothetical protein